MKIVGMIAREGRLARIEPSAHMVPHGDRSGVVIEPWLTDQWYVDAKTLAQPALAAVRDGRTVFTPKNWEKTYFEWLENIQPWCVSRQLWWGHQIPAWTSPWGATYVEEDEETAFAVALADGVEQGMLGADEAESLDRPAGQARRDVPARRGRARHLVLLGSVAVLDARLAARRRRSSSASIRPACSSPASTSSSSGSPA